MSDSFQGIERLNPLHRPSASVVVPPGRSWTLTLGLFVWFMLVGGLFWFGVTRVERVCQQVRIPIPPIVSVAHLFCELAHVWIAMSVLVPWQFGFVHRSRGSPAVGWVIVAIIGSVVSITVLMMLPLILL